MSTYICTKAAESAVAMMSALFSAACLETIMRGLTCNSKKELFCELAMFANHSNEIMKQAAAAQLIFPGVYVYAVEEVFGQHLAAQFNSGTYHYHDSVCHLYALAKNYFRESASNLGKLSFLDEYASRRKFKESASEVEQQLDVWISLNKLSPTSALSQAAINFPCIGRYPFSEGIDTVAQAIEDMSEKLMMNGYDTFHEKLAACRRNEKQEQIVRRSNVLIT